MQTIEKRRHPRSKANILANIHTENLSNIITIETSDLSETGAGILSETKLPEKMDIEFLHPILPYKTKITSNLRWNNNSHSGIEFASPEVHAANIKKLLWACDEYIITHINPLLEKIRIEKSEILLPMKDFFVNRVKTYLENICAVFLDIKDGKISDDSGYVTIEWFVNDITRNGTALLNRLHNKALGKEIKKAFREMVGGWIYESEYMKRGMEKPRGYPGDYMMIESIYKNVPQSEGLGFYIDKFFLNNSYASSVRNRKEKAVEILRNYLNSCQLPQVNMLNLGAGSCREIKELLEKDFQYKGILDISCVDYDSEALAYASELLSDIPKNVEIQYLKEDVVSLPKNLEFIRLVGQQNVIYSLGMIDYLPDRILKNLISFWYYLLKKDGELILTHKDIDADPEAPYAPDWYCDWKFVTRNRQEFIDLVKTAVPDMYLSSEGRDKTGKIIFLIVRKTHA